MRNEFSVVGDKGRLVIPAGLGRKYAIGKGTRMAIIEEANRLVLQPLNRQFIRSLRGSLRGGLSVLRVLLQERKRGH
jgi:bifunctional DNA-binding transcriptional regulator/antitoxin component of YhaV-PrlF toxin-antitoxin module